MNKRHSWLFRRLAILLVCFSLLIPPPAAAAEVCFTAVNDNVLPLTADTMPIWYKSLIYVPYTVFDSGSTGVDLGLNSTYDPSSAMVNIYNLRQILAFDLNAGTCRDPSTDTYYNVRAVMRNGRPYVPLNTCVPSSGSAGPITPSARAICCASKTRRWSCPTLNSSRRRRIC